MNTYQAFANGAANQGKELMVFDWDKAAKLIKERQPQEAGAGLRGDWEWTGGIIYENGEIVEDSYTYLSSTWATPELEMDGETIDCFIMKSQTEWDCETKWPDTAKEILKSND